LTRQLPADRRDRPSWRHVTAEFEKATDGTDPAGAAVALHMALVLGGKLPIAAAKMVVVATASLDADPYIPHHWTNMPS
jgi:hypothetical protein